MASIAKFDTWQDSTGTTRSTVLKTYSINSAQQTSTTSTSFVIANPFSIIVTPQSVNSKFVLLSSNFAYVNQNAQHMCATFYRNSTNLGQAYGITNYYTNAGGYTEFPIAMTYVDSPNTTSAVTYAIYIRSGLSTNNVVYGDTNNRMGNFTILEIAG